MTKAMNMLLSGSIVLGMLMPPSLWAHGGEDHSDHAEEAKPAPVLAPVGMMGMRLEWQSPDVELLGILQADQLTLYADHFATNEPLANASIELESRGQKLALKTGANGVAQGKAAWLAKPGRYEIMATVIAKDISDLLSNAVTIPQPTTNTAASSTEAAPWWKFWLEATILPKPAFAHGGEDHDHPEENKPLAPVPVEQDKPVKLADGNVFVPKPVQHLLGLRTVVSQPQKVAQSFTLNGVVVNDPNATAHIQPTQSGRVLAPKQGFPTLGSRVEKNQVIAVLEPAANNVDKGDQEDKLADLRSQLTLAEKNAQRLESIAGVIPQMEVDAARNTVDTLKARLQALQGSRAQQPEILRAPISGIISTTNVTLGQQANAGDVLFEIIDPNQLQIEALAYDAALVGQISQGSVLINEQILPLSFVGSSQQLRNQALPLRFQIQPSALKGEAAVSALAIGQPLKITVQTRVQVQGIPLPASSVVNNSQMEPVVWLHTQAERFVPYKVKVQPLNAEQVVVTEGLAGNSIRAVTQGAALLSQVR